ncbi:MAG: hypothetical protein ONB48_16180 [candidate division KSB1 bacterium]|nr:hypothetical protein [candidate division KSB1 bacterium]MDZ7274291.1 hypothetical protein [candidate division KSB1 bacterium]MDZ7287187.1 hypothetical protein [candidate division KSB1 bacterium]MDZ7296888.1 hypothetical protein [candidate division KSB1 bacterium]MDZ7306007.1 hypothetical protein [candidate division KSB1 bacterium]
MITEDKELQPGYEWELDFHCVRCGAAHDLLFDKATEKMYCVRCWRMVQSGLPTQPEPVEFQE